MIITLLIIFSVLLIIICGSVFQLSFIHLILLEVTRIGVALLGLKESLMLQELNIFYLSSVWAFCLGLLFVYFYHRYGANPGSITERIFNRLNFGKKGLFRASGIFTVLIIYHYLVLGIPILYPDFEIRRFMVATSGLLGVPSRISIYGPIVIMFFSISYFSSGWISGKKFIFISFSCLILFLLIGHKSSIIAYGYIFICAYRFSTVKMNRALPIVAILSLPVVLFFIYFQFVYFSTLREYVFSEYVIHRLTLISIMPLIHIFYDEPALEMVSAFAFLHDLLYPFLKLLGSDMQSINTQVSQSLYGIRYGDFSVPVTYTFAGYARMEWGIYGGIIISFGFGVITGLVYYITQNQTTNIGRGAMMSFEYLMLIGLTSGNMFYLLPNFVFVIVLFVMLVALFNHALIKSIKQAQL